MRAPLRKKLESSFLFTLKFIIGESWTDEGTHGGAGGGRSSGLELSYFEIRYTFNFFAFDAKGEMKKKSEKRTGAYAGSGVRGSGVQRGRRAVRDG